eukprot:TRINITY_DN6688_c0_g1_i1.p1 TRINITY_DN6688_c0_g1~~TRINITY_DN6688_c0_g1_i1.p1  ORF type:complete len:600 (-),score=193.47 TRINITY_DN6688_c0_g1_i1:19-1818(-)
MQEGGEEGLKSYPLSIVSLYERAVIEFKNDARIWLKYLKYFATQFNGDSKILKLNERACKSCPWSGDLITNNFRVMERYLQTEKAENEIEKLYKKIYIGVSITTDYEWTEYFTAYSDFLIRKWRKCGDQEEKKTIETKFRQNYNDTISTFEYYYPQSVEHLRFLIAAARFEAFDLKNEGQTRILVEEVFKKEGNTLRSFQLVLEIERYSPIGDAERLRKQFKQASIKVIDAPDRMWQEWLTYESQYGDLASWQIAYDYVEKQRTERYKKATRAIEKEENALAEKERRKKEKEEKKEASYKRKLELREEEKKQEVEVKRQKINEAEQDNRTVIVTGFPLDMRSDEVEKTFSTIGKIKEVRLMRDKDKVVGEDKIYQNKGFGFVEFEEESSAAEAIKKMNGFELGGRILKVSISNKGSVEQRHPTRDSSSAHTVYVSQFVPTATCTEENIRSLFKNCGTVKNVRVNLDRKSKQPRGFAYIDFEDEKGVNEALKLNDTETPFGTSGHKIKVAISNPKGAPHKASVAPLIDEPITKTINQSQMMKPRGLLVPRQAAKPKSSLAPKPKLLSASPSVPAVVSGGDNQSEPQKTAPKSNADFRKFL